MNTNFKVIGLTRLVIKPESTAQRQTLYTTQPSELLIKNNFSFLDEKLVLKVSFFLYVLFVGTDCADTFQHTL